MSKKINYGWNQCAIVKAVETPKYVTFFCEFILQTENKRQMGFFITDFITSLKPCILDNNKNVIPDEIAELSKLLTDRTLYDLFFKQWRKEVNNIKEFWNRYHKYKFSVKIHKYKCESNDIIMKSFNMNFNDLNFFDNFKDE